MSSVKPIKMERTHEENQERAYIAASRRSDRGLETRVVSVKRASEIHKQRTGRSLRVNEQDVMNEEIYEEERDDLPAQHRRMTVYLQNANAEFYQRCQSHLFTNFPIPQAFDGAALYGMPTNFEPSVSCITSQPEIYANISRAACAPGLDDAITYAEQESPTTRAPDVPNAARRVAEAHTTSFDSHGYPLSLTAP
ncbi:hypothetical protein LTR22_025720 [Elasticomyces elasticus]|nr:hypothetical protein LTR22_025720 [Elasticomyces elasticus]KAK4897075.1 hypothetical protein LTR49_028042 [Elasticomyces elasticus]